MAEFRTRNLPNSVLIAGADGPALPFQRHRIRTARRLRRRLPNGANGLHQLCHHLDTTAEGQNSHPE